MLGKNVFSLILFISLTLNTYFIFSSPPSQHLQQEDIQLESFEKSDSGELKFSSTKNLNKKKAEPIPQRVSRVDSSIERSSEQRNSVPDRETITKEELEEIADRVAQKWNVFLEELFLTELYLPRSSFEKYQKLKIQKSDELSKLYEESWSNASGPGMTKRKPMHEMIKANAKIEEKYFNKLKALLGEENLRIYNERRQEFNRQMSQEENGIFIPAMF